MKKSIIFIAAACVLVAACIAGAGCTTSQINSVAQIVDPVVGTWESSMGSSYLDLNYDGTGSKTVLGITDSITWESTGNDVYIIGDLRYTLNGDTLEGPLATYYKK